MAFLKRWKENWELKSLTQEELFNVIVEIVTKQLDEVEKDEVALEANLVIDYEADSVDVVAMLLYLEDMFKNASETTRTVVPTDKLGQIVLVEDIFEFSISVGVIDIQETEEHYELTIPNEEFHAILEKLEVKYELPVSSSVEWKAKELLQLEKEKIVKVIELLEKLEDIDDVQNLYSNLKIPNDIL